MEVRIPIIQVHTHKYFKLLKILFKTGAFLLLRIVQKITPSLVRRSLTSKRSMPNHSIKLKFYG